LLDADAAHRACAGSAGIPACSFCGCFSLFVRGLFGEASVQGCLRPRLWMGYRLVFIDALKQLISDLYRYTEV
jgi:hypothetical protein